MQPPDELMVQEFLPSIRQLVARQLRTQGFSQNRISAMLGMTQASVSNYLASDVKKAYASLAQFEVSDEDADTYAALLAEDVKRNAVEAVSTLNTFWTGLLGRGSVCARHRSQHPSLADCDVCIKEYGHRRSELSDVVSEISDAVKDLESSTSFVKAMPEVSVNIACVAGDSDSAADVVAVPGRIVRVRGRAKAMLTPEPGASRHLSKVLLLVKKVRPDLRASINLRFDSRMGRILRKLGLKTVEIGDYDVSGTDDPTIKALVMKLATYRSGFDAVVDRGGNGIEPNVYLFAKGAREVVALALRVSRLYSAG